MSVKKALSWAQKKRHFGCPLCTNKSARRDLRVICDEIAAGRASASYSDIGRYMLSNYPSYFGHLRNLRHAIWSHVSYHGDGGSVEVVRRKRAKRFNGETYEFTGER